MSKNEHGRYGVLDGPLKGIPLHEVREVDVNRVAKQGKGKKSTPKKTALKRQADLTHAQRVRDAVNAVDLWKLLGNPTPCLMHGPYDPTQMFADSAIELARRGREIAHRAMEVSPAAANDAWRSYTRMEQKINGEGCSFQPLYQPFDDACDEYRARWEAEQRRQEEKKGRSKGKGPREILEHVEAAVELAKKVGKGKGPQGRSSGSNDKSESVSDRK